MRWKQPSYFDYLDAWSPSKDKNIIVFLQSGEASKKSDEEDEGYLGRVDWVYVDAGMSDFRKAFYTSNNCLVLLYTDRGNNW